MNAGRLALMLKYRNYIYYYYYIWHNDHFLMSLMSFIILLLFICKYVIVILVQMYIDIISIMGVLRRRILWSFCRRIFLYLIFFCFVIAK